jgi:hypothetical protein
MDALFVYLGQLTKEQGLSITKYLQAIGKTITDTPG